MLSPTTLGDTGDERYQEELHQCKNFKKTENIIKIIFIFQFTTNCIYFSLVK